MTQSQIDASAVIEALKAQGIDLSQLQNASAIGQDRIVRKEAALGAVRQLPVPEEHIGDTIAPWKDVPFDDVIFNYLTVETTGLAPARAEDAESELAQKDDTLGGEGRASVIDWAVKDHYDASDVNRARDFRRILEQMQGGALPLVAEAGLADFNAKVARDRALRRLKFDNRREQLIIDSMANGSIVYNDGKIKFAVPWGRPDNQSAGNAAFDLAKAGITDGTLDLSSPEDFDPIRFFNELNEWFFDLYGVHLKRVTAAKDFFNKFWLSQKFSQRAGLGAVYDAQGNPGAPDLLYAAAGWSPDAARRVVEASTGMELREYDSGYRTRAVGSKQVVFNRFLPKTRIFFEPDYNEIREIATTEIGFAKTLTSPHPEGNWTTGYYEWERSTVDPWGQDIGNGIKMFPVFPHMEYTVSLDVVLPN
jgi:hypothetical protein